MEKIIELANVESEEENIRKLIRDSGKTTPSRRTKTENLYGCVNQRLSRNTRNSVLQIEYLGAYEKALSVFRECSRAIREGVDVMTLEERLATLNSDGNGKKKESVGKATIELEEEIKEAISFSNRYALYFAGQVGLAILNSEIVKTDKRFVWGADNYASVERDDLCSKLAIMASDDLQRVVETERQLKEETSDEDLRSTFECVFTTWINQFNWKIFEGLAKKYGVDDTLIKYQNFSVKAGEFKRKYSTVRVENFMDVKKEDIIGPQEFHRVIWDNLIRLLAYDPEKRKNPFRPAKVIFSTGDPGCGKTIGAQAYIRSAGDVASELGIPFWAFPFSITDFGTEYKDKAAVALGEICKQIIAFPGPVVEYVSDADALFQSRKDPRATQEDLKVMSVFFGKYDGTRIPKNGKFMAVMDANYTKSIDEASKSRLFDVVLRLERFKTPGEFGEYARRYLSRDAPVGVNPNEWEEIGKYLLEGPLSNREIEHVLSGLTRGYDIPIDILRRSYDEKVEFRNQYFGDITKDKILGALDLYIQTRMEIERASRDALASDSVERFLASIKQPGPSTANISRVK